VKFKKKGAIMKLVRRLNLLLAYKCQSCGTTQQAKGECDECGYSAANQVRISRKQFCKLFGHLSLAEGQKKTSSRLDCCTEHFTYRCRRCGASVKHSVTNSWGCMAHGPL